MSVVLMIYSRSACREFVLPALHNEEYSIKIDSEIFELYQDVSLHLEENRENGFSSRTNSILSTGQLEMSARDPAGSIRAGMPISAC